MIYDRFDRQERLFGSEGQKHIREAHVGIVGLGGLGSLVVQSLAMLGVGSMTFIDQDIVDGSNLNRLIGATAKDILARIHKVDIMKRMVNSIDARIHTRPIRTELRTVEALAALKESTCIFGCVDHDGPRLVLTELCAAYEIPYIDLASEVIPGTPFCYGGRIFTSIDDKGCLSCYGEISTDEVQQYLESEEMRDTRRAIYGVEEENLADSGPSVITLNTVVAGHAVTEFMVLTTGLREPSRLLTYRGDLGGIVCKSDDAPIEPDCYYCKAVRGIGNATNVERYIISAAADRGHGTAGGSSVGG